MAKKIICVPDSFKGTISSGDICEVMERATRAVLPDIQVIKIPVADGGEGSVDAVLAAAGGEKVHVRVKGPFFEDVEAFYGLIDGGKTAVIEMAACAGLPLAGQNKNPLLATTYGVGELITHAIQSGCKKIVMGLGGSATNDAGAGMACALGCRFLDASDRAFVPTGGTLADIAHIDASEMLPGLKDTQFVTMCDINNPMYGINGAAYVFAPQKGASPQQVEALDKGLRHISVLFTEQLGRDVSLLSGSGAAGGMGGGMVAFLGSSLRSGIETVLDLAHFDSQLDGADVVFTGEGRLDSQSLGGKVVAGVAARARAKGVRVVAVVGGAAGDIGGIYDMGVTAVFPINRLPEDLSVSGCKTADNLYATMCDILRLIKSEDRQK